MIKGHTNSDLAPIVTVEIVDDNGRLKSLQAILDTGFDGDLSLSEEAIRKHGLKTVGERDITLANGDVDSIPFCIGVLSYGTHKIEVIVLQMGEESLVGMAPFRDGKMALEVWNGGRVTVRFPRRRVDA